MDYSLTELQLALLRVLWERREATVIDVQEALAGERRMAQSTVATLLSRMEKKALVTHRAEGRVYVYRPLVSEHEVRHSVVAEFTDLADKLFHGDLAAMVSHLLTARDVEPADLARVRILIETRERELGRKES